MHQIKLYEVLLSTNSSITDMLLGSPGTWKWLLQLDSYLDAILKTPYSILS